MPRRLVLFLLHLHVTKASDCGLRLMPLHVSRIQDSKMLSMRFAGLSPSRVRAADTLRWLRKFTVLWPVHRFTTHRLAHRFVCQVWDVEACSYGHDSFLAIICSKRC